MNSRLANPVYVATPYLSIIVGDEYARLLEALQTTHRKALADDRTRIVNLWADLVRDYTDELSFFAKSTVIQRYRPQIQKLIAEIENKNTTPSTRGV